MEQAVRADGVEKSPYNLKGLLTNITKNLITNPIIMGIVAGLIWRISTVPYSGLLADTAATMGATAGPLALFSVGMSLNKYGIKSNLLQGSLLASLSLIVFPAAVYVLTIYVFHLPVRLGKSCRYCGRAANRSKCLFICHSFQGC